MDRSKTDSRDSPYDDDFYGWTQDQASLLRAGRLAEADLPNIIEEIETLGRSELSALRSAYRLVALHLLTMRFQPSRRTRSWVATVVRERGTIEMVLKENLGLRPKRAETLAVAYTSARREAAAETHLPIATFPETCPFSLDEIEGHDVWP